MFFYARLASSTAIAIHLLTSGMLANGLPALPSGSLSLSATAPTSNVTLVLAPASTGLASMVKRDDVSASASLEVPSASISVGTAAPSIAIRQLNSTDLAPAASQYSTYS